MDCDFRNDDDRQAHTSVPSCPDCGGPLRPGMVLFGERRDPDAEMATRRAVRSCEPYLAVGTSSVVNTSTGLLRYAGDVGALTVCVDPAPTVDSRYAVHVRGTAAQVLPVLFG